MKNDILIKMFKNKTAPMFNEKGKYVVCNYSILTLIIRKETHLFTIKKSNIVTKLMHDILYRWDLSEQLLKNAGYYPKFYQEGFENV
jgi:hypothetical protein